MENEHGTVQSYVKIEKQINKKPSPRIDTKGYFEDETLIDDEKKV